MICWSALYLQIYDSPLKCRRISAGSEFAFNDNRNCSSGYELSLRRLFSPNESISLCVHTWIVSFTTDPCAIDKSRKEFVQNLFTLNYGFLRWPKYLSIISLPCTQGEIKTLTFLIIAITAPRRIGGVHIHRDPKGVEPGMESLANRSKWLINAEICTMAQIQTFFVHTRTARGSRKASV